MSRFSSLRESLAQRAEILTPFLSLMKCRFLTGRYTPEGLLRANLPAFPPPKSEAPPTLGGLDSITVPRLKKTPRNKGLDFISVLVL